MEYNTNLFDSLIVSHNCAAVSYTHLDVYKRQVLFPANMICTITGPLTTRFLWGHPTENQIFDEMPNKNFKQHCSKCAEIGII